MALMSSLAVAVAGIGHFKTVNDTHGHLAGDAVLAAVSPATRDLLRDCDLCGRSGGEEFALLLPRTTADQALKIAERIRQGISRLTVPQDGTTAIQVTVSIGVAAPPHPRWPPRRRPRPVPSQEQRTQPRHRARRHPGSAGRTVAAAS